MAHAHSGQQMGMGGSERWLNVLASLFVGTCFFALWFWLLPQWLGFRVEAAGILQAGVGKASFDANKLVENIRAFTDAVNKAKPAGAKGHYINRVSISSTMGPGVKVDMATLAPVAATK